MTERQHGVTWALGLGALLAATLVAFWPGLTGPFLFDDINNLQPLGAGNGIQSLADLARFVFSGEAGPLGRPLSLLTFAMNDVGWPSDPWPFKYTNLLIHALNGVLVFVLARELAGLLAARRAPAAAIALGAAAIWLLHPLQLTPVFLVVQRMTELSALFVLLGLIVYLVGRRTAAARPVAGYVVMSLAVGLGGVLAVFSKENGILLPLFILVIEATVARATPAPRRPWRAVFLWLPLALLVAYIGRSLLHVDGEPLAHRDFSMAQRLLTEPRVLLDYLRAAVLPSLRGSGLFHDDYAASTGFLTPASTLPAIALLMAGFVGALVYRRRYPVLAFAVLWFLAGHCLEAGPVNLELYFEHRNYLPLLGPAFAGAWYALHAPIALRRFALFALVAFVALCGFATWRASLVWGDFGRLAVITAAENPSSIRAQQAAAKYWYGKGRPARAAAYLERARSQHPNNVGPALQLMYIDCSDGALDATELPGVLRAARHGPFTHMVQQMLGILRSNATPAHCQGLALADLLRIEQTLLANHNYQANGTQSMLYYAVAHIYADQHIIDKTLVAADKAYAADPAYEIAMQAALWLVSAGDFDLALKYIDKARHTRGENWYERLDGQQQEIDSFETAVIEARARQLTGAQAELPRAADTATVRSTP